MAWDFETEPEFTPLDETRRKVVDPLKDEVRRQELWATHIRPELGGQGYGQLKLALLNEILGRSSWAPIVFGCQAPDTGNAEIIAHYGTPEQKERYLRPLLDGEQELMDLLTSGRVAPHIGATFGLDDTAAALRYVADGRAVGKVVLDIGGAAATPGAAGTAGAADTAGTAGNASGPDGHSTR